MFYVYVLKLSNNTCYTGKSANLKERIKEHQAGYNPTTRRFLPMDLVFYAAFEAEELADQFESYLKSGSGIAFRNKRLIR